MYMPDLSSNTVQWYCADTITLNFSSHHFEQYKIVGGVVIGHHPITKLTIQKLFPAMSMGDLQKFMLVKFPVIQYSSVLLCSLLV